jgi:hypothetical protein
MGAREGRAAVVATGAVVVAAALGGCGEKTLETGNVEKSVRQQFADKLRTPVAAVDCPDSVPARKGGEFRCTARFPDGETDPVQVVQTDDEGHVRARLVNIVTGKLERLITAQFAAQGLTVTTRCPDRHPIRRGDVFTCSVRDRAGRSGTVRVTQLDDAGRVRFELVRG